MLDPAVVGGIHRLLAAAVLGSACGASEVDPDAVVAAARANLIGQGLSPDEVRCEAWTEHGAQCRARVMETMVPLDVHRAPDGALVVQARHPTLIVARLRDQVRATLADAGHSVQSVACVGELWLARAGEVGVCTMTDAAGGRWEYRATFTGVGAQHRATIVPR